MVGSNTANYREPSLIPNVSLPKRPCERDYVILHFVRTFIGQTEKSSTFKPNCKRIKMLKALSTRSSIYKEDLYRFKSDVPLYFLRHFFQRNVMGVTVWTKSQKLMMCFSDSMSGRFALLGITWMASGLGAVHRHSCRILRRGNAAVPRIIPIVMRTVTMKMLAVRLIEEVGANASGQVITWPVFIKATAMNLTALTNSDAARWIKVITFHLIHTWTKNQL